MRQYNCGIMLKRLVVLVLFLTAVFTLVPMFGQVAATSGHQSAKHHAQSSKEKDTPPNSISTTSQASNDDIEHRVKLTEMPPVSLVKTPKGWLDHVFDWGPWVFTLLLVVVGAIAGYFSWRTLNEISKQAKIMKRQANTMDQQSGVLRDTLSEIQAQAGHMKEQVALMESQTHILERSVAAAEKSAKAASDNIELVIQKERARLRIKIADLNMKSSITIPQASLTLFHYGSTEAFITETGWALEVAGPQEPAEDDLRVTKMHNLPDVIAPNAPPILVTNSLFHYITQAERDLIEEGKAFVYLRGFIEYKDRFDRQHAIRFYRKWYVTDMGKPFGKLSFWTNCGRTGDNIEV